MRVGAYVLHHLLTYNMIPLIDSVLSIQLCKTGDPSSMVLEVLLLSHLTGVTCCAFVKTVKFNFYYSPFQGYNYVEVLRSM